jgi:hypothetical protein
MGACMAAMSGRHDPLSPFALVMQADILMVTDGEIPMPDKSILDTIKGMHDSKGLEVHGLLVASQAGVW